MRLPSSLAVLAATIAQTHAQYLVSDLSFGYGARISPDGTHSIPNFSLHGNPNLPEVLSNKLILTPPAPGNQRAAVWSDGVLKSSNWILDVEFRANGPERGGGNLNIWVVRDGRDEVGTASIYTAQRFDGLALVIDGHGGYGGMLRAFLNDGSADYRNQRVDQLSFGHCSLSYRNLGRPSQIKLRHTDASFKVEVDGELCFESDKVRLPPGYHLGITAASADNPDSFEVFKLVVLTEDDTHGSNPPADNPGHPQQNRAGGEHVVYGRGGFHVGDTNAAAAGHQAAAAAAGQQQQTSPNPNTPPEPVWDADIPDAKADAITSSRAQFADLHDRLQSVNHHLQTLFRTVATNVQTGEARHEEVSVMLGELKGLLTSRVAEKLDRLDGLDGRLAALERELRSVRADLAQKMRETEHSVRAVVVDRHDALRDHVRAHAAPGHARVIAVVLGSQALLVGAYVLYKRRKAGSAKKYL